MFILYRKIDHGCTKWVTKTYEWNMLLREDPRGILEKPCGFAAYMVYIYEFVEFLS